MKKKVDGISSVDVLELGYSLQTQYTVGQHNHLTIFNSRFLPQWKATEIFDFSIFRDDGARQDDKSLTTFSLCQPRSP